MHTYGYGQGYGFSSGHVWMWELDWEESWVPKNWCFWTVVLEKTLESPLDCKKIQPVHPKGDQSWVFIGRTDAEAETLILWPPQVKSWLIVKDLDAGRNWGQEKKGTTEDEMAGWHHWLDGHEFEWTPGVCGGQGGLMCCNSWGRRVRHDWATELNWTELIYLQGAIRDIQEQCWAVIQVSDGDTWDHSSSRWTVLLGGDADVKKFKMLIGINMNTTTAEQAYCIID